jgi:tetratricopeptide (TPR) repeat protein
MRWVTSLFTRSATSLCTAVGCVVLLLASAATSAQGSGDFLQAVRQWSEWGDYSKIIEAVPKYLDTATVPIDDHTMAEFRKHMGVAYFASGLVEEARAEFIAAYKLDPAVSLDRSYVSEEIYAVFTSTIDAQKRKAAEAAARDTLARMKEQEKKREKESTLRARRRADFVLAVAGVALAGVFAGGAAYEYGVAEDAYDEFEAAAQAGDLREYENKRDDVKTGDQLTVASSACSAACAVTGTFFFVRWLQRLKQSRGEQGAEKNKQ